MKYIFLKIKWCRKMLITLLDLLFISLLQRTHCITVKTTHANITEKKDIKLVDLLKQDLRKNNDDYIDKLNNYTNYVSVLNKQSGTDKVVKTNIKEQLTDNFTLKKPNHMVLGKNANRRYIDFSDEINYNKYSFSPATLTSNPSTAVPTINPNRFQKVQTLKSEIDTNLSLQDKKSSDNYPKYINKAKIDKFKLFLDKNKGLIQDFVINKKREEIQTTESMPALRDNYEQANREMMLRANSNEKRRIPGPKQLDMAPAKGGRIHNMRLKGRLCQRHVLVPEGPKYDSKGKVYLAAYKGRGEYANTKPPRLVLPRCCNCCMKSVLGCE